MESLFHAQPAAEAVFRPDKMGKATLWQGDQMMVGLNAFEPGQEHALHAHEGLDKLYCVLSGQGRFQVGDVTRDLTAGGLVVAPAGVRHSVCQSGDERLVVLVTMAPPPGKKTA